jgi:hypothetical protein
MRRLAALVILLPAFALATGAIAEAQDEPRRIGPFVLDVRGSLPGFPGDPALAASRGLETTELPGRGLGADVGAHVYLLTWKAVTIGLGGQVTLARAHASPETGSSLLAVTERFVSIAPLLSLNFGTGHGWSYISGGVGRAQWSLVPDVASPGPADVERLKTVNYGGGARWFSHPHVAFTFDVRFHVIGPGTPQLDLPGSPRATLLIMSAGISLK